MINQKRGLSDVVTVSLIILLAIAAVVIVWTFLRPTLENTGKEIAGANCLTVEAKAISCAHTRTVPGDITSPVASTAVVVENGPGQTTIDKLKLVFYASAAANSNSDVVDGGTGCDSIGPLSRKTCAITGVRPNSFRVSVAPILGDKTCAVSTETVTCTG